MSLTRIDEETAVNLDAVASIKFSQTGDGVVASVNFLSAAPGNTFMSETFSGDAARNLYDLIGGHTAEERIIDGESSEELQAAPFGTEFLRTKGWYFATGADGRRYFIAFINAKGSCSMRTFDAETGRFITRQYRSGHYQQQFAGVIQDAAELTLASQPNLERDCKVRLPESVLVELKKQTK
ncbi:MAG: hypothetical protein ACJ71Q_20075 [Terriglobales bacterium]